MTSIEEFRERYAAIQAEPDENTRRRHHIELVGDIETAKRSLSDEDALPYHELTNQIGMEVFGVGQPAPATPESPDTPVDENTEDESAEATAQRKHALSVAELTARRAAMEADQTRWDALGAKSSAERAAANLKRDRVRRSTTVITGLLLIGGFLFVMFTLWFFFRGPSATEQLEDEFRKSCIDKGWSYTVDATVDGLTGTPHGNCEKPNS